MVAREGAQLDIACPVEVPADQEQPRVLWTLDEVPLNLNSPEFALLVSLWVGMVYPWILCFIGL